MEVQVDNTDARLAEDSNDTAYIEEMQRPYRSQMSIRDLRERNIADKAARQCRGDIGVYTDGSRLLVDVAVGDATTAPSYATASTRRHQMSPWTPRRMPPPLVGDRANAAAAKMMLTSRIPHSPASPGNRSP